ncbi:MAG: XRE family transcriptional regulator [Firmicutes bacterium HGW-Firmicutes-17]|jgi:hypothetical protein|nr:MAG: XRE family transcriptional regulator [Firmicutes bacterium HGW-Firmicutes-17]
MTILERIQEQCAKVGTSVGAIEKEIGFGNGTIYKWKDRSPSTDNLIKVADHLGVSVDSLLGRESSNLNRKDQRDIEKILADTREQLLTSEGLMFDGQPATEEDMQQILDAMQIGLEMAKKKNKDKYTPKKYRK